MTKLRITEAAFQKTVIDTAHTYGWMVAHFRPARVKGADGKDTWRTAVAADGKGFPDLVLVRDRVIFAELKADSGALSAEQRQWIGALETAGIEAYVWRPNDFDLLAAILRHRGGN